MSGSSEEIAASRFARMMGVFTQPSRVRKIIFGSGLLDVLPVLGISVVLVCGVHPAMSKAAEHSVYNANCFFIG